MSQVLSVQETAVSRDGTPIAHWRTGHSTPGGTRLVLVHGTTADHTRWRTLLPLLEPHVTVHAMDRRGRGGSGDAPGYSLQREAEDVAAVVDAVALDADEPVAVFGHSYGAHCALEAALLTDRINAMVLYEPALTAINPPGWLDRMDALLAQGRAEDVVVCLLRDLAALTDPQIGDMRADPSWPNRVAAAHTVVRETRAEEDYRFVPDRFGRLRVPTLLLTGTLTPSELAASTTALGAALPDHRIVALAGQGHVAMLTAPEVLAREIIDFVTAAASRAPRPSSPSTDAATGR